MSACYVLDVMYVMLADWARKRDEQEWQAGREQSHFADLESICGASIEDDEDDEDEYDDGTPAPTNLYHLHEWIERVNRAGVSG